MMIEKEIQDSLTPPSSSQHCLRGRIGEFTVVFPSQWVLDIVVVERRKILHLPFYSKTLLGVVHYQSTLVPLVYLENTIPEADSSQMFVNHVMAVRLGPEAGELSGAAIIIDQLLGNSQNAGTRSQIDFQLSHLSPQSWRPLLEQSSFI